MKFVFSTGSLYTYGADRTFDLARNAGFDGMEVLIDMRWDTRQPDYLRRLMDRHQLPIKAVHSPFVPVVPGWPYDDPGRIAETVKVAEAVHAPVVVHHLPMRRGWVAMHIGRRRRVFRSPFPDRDAGYRSWLLDGYQELQASTSVKLCIENMPARRWMGRDRNLFQWNTPAEIVRFPSLTFDTTHYGTWGMEPDQVYPRLNGQVRHVHLSNFNGREHRRPEDGRLHLGRLIKQLVADKYAGVVCLELDPSGLAAGESDIRLTAQLERSLDICRRWAED